VGLLSFARRAAPAKILDRFFARYAGRRLIVHEGFPAEWLEELMKQPGGAGYFRIDLRTPRSNPPTPVEWVAHEQLRALELPLPLFVDVRDGELLVRHLTRGGEPVHPSEILWFIDEIDERHHARLRRVGGVLEPRRVLAVEDNEPLSMFG
jgi:hypothetical protein